MENEFTEFLNQNWNEKYKVSVTSSSLHSNVNGVPGDTLNHAILQQYHQQSLRVANSSSSNYESIRLAFIQHRQQSTNNNEMQSSLSVQRNSATGATCPKLINIHSMKGKIDTTLPYDCQSKYRSRGLFICNYFTQKWLFPYDNDIRFQLTVLYPHLQQLHHHQYCPQRRQ